jgi:hypothetical protein
MGTWAGDAILPAWYRGRVPVESALAILPYFARLRADERLRIAERFRTAELPAGETLTVEPDAPELVLVLAGQGELTLDGGAPVTLYAGDAFGELDVVIGKGPRAKLKSISVLRIARLDRAGLDALFVEYPAIAPPWVAELSRELKWRNDLIREASVAYAEKLPPEQLEAMLERRRRNLQRHRRSPVRRATARLVKALFTAPGSRPSFWVLLGALSALAAARTMVAVILKNGLQKHLFALIGSKVGHPIHVHHFNYGLALVSITGALVLIPRTRRAIRRLAFLFGFGVGLIVDEFALFWNLNPDYYQPSSRLMAGVVLIVLVNIVYFRSMYIALAKRVVEMVRA